MPMRKKTYDSGIEDLIKVIRLMIRKGMPAQLIRHHMRNAGWSDEWFQLAWRGALLLERG